MITLQFNKNDIERINRGLSRISDVRKRSSVLYRAFVRLVLTLRIKLQENVTNRILKVRSGRLRGSIGSKVYSSAEGLTGKVGSGVGVGERVSYANILESGGIIKPKKGKYLTIPLPEALTKAGVPKRPSARAWDNTFIYKSKGNNLIIAQRKKGGGVLPLYILKKRVKVPAKRYMSKTVQAYGNLAFRSFFSELSKGVRRWG